MNRPLIKAFVYGAVVVLCLVVLTFVAFSGSMIANTHVVYQNF
jgi:hypothetical protein